MDCHGEAVEYWKNIRQNVLGEIIDRAWGPQLLTEDSSYQVLQPGNV